MSPHRVSYKKSDRSGAIWRDMSELERNGARRSLPSLKIPGRGRQEQPAVTATAITAVGSTRSTVPVCVLCHCPDPITRTQPLPNTARAHRAIPLQACGRCSGVQDFENIEFSRAWPAPRRAGTTAGRGLGGGTPAPPPLPTPHPSAYHREAEGHGPASRIYSRPGRKPPLFLPLPPYRELLASPEPDRVALPAPKGAPPGLRLAPGRFLGSVSPAAATHSSPRPRPGGKGTGD